MKSPAPIAVLAALSLTLTGTPTAAAGPLTAVATAPATSTTSGDIDLSTAKAVWVAPDLLAWPAKALPAGHTPAKLTWRLHSSPRGGITRTGNTLNAPASYDLTWQKTGLPASVLTTHPHLKDYLALKAPAALATQAGNILKGQIAVTLHDDRSRLHTATGAQVAPVLDTLYARRAVQNSYGVTWSAGRPTLRLWAPTAHKVTLLTWPAGSAADAPTATATRTAMTPDSDGSWAARGPVSWKNARYLYEIDVLDPATGKIRTNQVTDPYSTALTPDSTRSVVVDLTDPALAPAQWKQARPPKLTRSVDQSIYELHIRDFSASDAKVPPNHRGTYLAFADQGHGTRHLRALASAGLNTVHLLPSFDITSVPENKSAQQRPPCDLRSYPADSEEQQRCLQKTAAKDAFNWGYDPYHFLAPEGSYASSTQNADGAQRIREFRTMVGGLHASGLRVVLDQVYNHTAAHGQAAPSVLDRVVPGYYHRLDATGKITTSTCCSNTATEHAMMNKLMVDATVSWAKHYKVDGFRFDLMGHHSVSTMKAVRTALNRLTPAADGIDGRAITLYGEGWNFGEVADNARFVQASQGQLGGTDIATFNDRLRDAVRGGGPFDADPRKQGFATGLADAPNGSPANGDPAAQTARLRHETDLIQLGLAGNLRGYTFRSQASGRPTAGAKIDYNGKPAGYADQPGETVTYVDAHDNETLFDALTLKLHPATTMSDRIRMNTLALSTTAFSQGISFWHAGADLLRSKSLDRNSYNSGDWFNLLDFSMQDNGFGRGLPPAGDNKAKWPYQKPLLADPRLKPAPQDIRAAAAAAQDLLRLRHSTPLFRLGSADAVKAKLSFPASGTASAVPGVIAMRLDDTRGAPVDPRLRGIVVVFNSTPAPVRQAVPGMAGQAASLSPIQAAGTDPVVRKATWDRAAGAAHVPARTVAVFVQTR
ncbi:alpha-1,6-glucosidases, pullulanase-type [Austwickia chelonae]|uniref:Putative glycosidase n=1 Tax=Austwickia chelonae NBRC 105200 TaxID=1184607 RepID=K6UKS6_9MICO|nr:pullulanase-type alpha-1,6-glucosidase [Austwickia chelonae]GAB76656.1 putative glycosidase [Austwickia chelonae NBRC 105200]SEW28800.1 alpha-1,6-glucosidases, pullulanase-type [Austwickia chelonae]